MESLIEVKYIVQSLIRVLRGPVAHAQSSPHISFLVLLGVGGKDVTVKIDTEQHHWVRAGSWSGTG
jgi:hypothetical protein